MPTTLKEDLKVLDSLAFNRREYSEPDLRRYHALAKNRRGPIPCGLDSLHRWMLVPITLWPLNIHDIFSSCLDVLEAGRIIDPEMEVLIQSLPIPPSQEVCRTVAEHEHLVQSGSYESLVATTTKFDSIEKQARRNPQLRREWQAIKKQWDTSQYADEKGILRRTLTGERNLRPRFKVDWSIPRHRFQAAFDVFCSKWNLYGMEGDKPLTMKLSVNLTPYGTMIFIPVYWSFDPKRDLRWDAVKKLHRARSLKKQGEVLTEGLEERRANAARLRVLDAEAKRLDLRGEKKHAFLCKELGWVAETSPKRLSALRKEFPAD